MAKTTGLEPIELRIKEVGQLFQSLDPLPFRERDLDQAVEEYVVGWASEMSPKQAIEICVHLPSTQAKSDAAEHIDAAITNYFRYRAEVIGWEMKELFRRGRVSLATGLGVLAVCVMAGRLVGDHFGTGYVARFFGEGIIILGWVANWRPIEIFLYDWWPIRRRRQLYCRLAHASVRLVYD
jgi:hypothetical protein